MASGLSRYTDFYHDDDLPATRLVIRPEVAASVRSGSATSDGLIDDELPSAFVVEPTPQQLTDYIDSNKSFSDKLKDAVYGATDVVKGLAQYTDYNLKNGINLEPLTSAVKSSYDDLFKSDDQPIKKNDDANHLIDLSGDNLVDRIVDYLNNKPFSLGSEAGNKLTGTVGRGNPTGERYQLWPERLVREALSPAGDAVAGKLPTYTIDPITGEAHTSPKMIEAAQAMSALAGTGGLGGVGAEAGTALGAGPFLRPALKYGEKLYKGKEGQQHLDLIPADLYPTFQKQAMNGDDISHWNFGFYNDKGHFLTRDKALQYGIDNGIIDPQSGKFGALTSTMMSDSSKPGAALEAIKFTMKPPKTLYRGIVEGQQESGAQGLGTSHLGKGLYTSANKSFAKKYATNGDIREFTPEDAFPRNPLILNGAGGAGSLLLDHIFKNTNLKNAREVTKAYPDIGDYVRSLGHDGVVVNRGEEIVKYPMSLFSDSSQPAISIQALKAAEKPFYSGVENALLNAKQGKADAAQWLGYLKNQPGVKQEELQHLGLDKLQGSITKDDLLKAVQEGQPQINTVIKGSNNPYPYRTSDEWQSAITKAERNGNFDEAERLTLAWEQHEGVGGAETTKFDKYTLPGGENYREMLLTLPTKNTREIELGNQAAELSKSLRQQYGEQWFMKAPKEQVDKYQSLIDQSVGAMDSVPQYKSSHWDEPNVLAHIRMNDRNIPTKGYVVQNTTSGNKSQIFGSEAEAKAYQSQLPASIKTNIVETQKPAKTLHVEEIQSDWHQAGRKHNYRNDNPSYNETTVENAPAHIRQALENNKFNLDTIKNEKLYDYGQGRYSLKEPANKETIADWNTDAVPDAPFKKTWDELAIKNVLDHAVKNGYDQVSWTPGEAQAARYDLSKSVNRIEVPMINKDGSRSVRIDTKTGSPFKLMVDKNGIVEGHGASSSQFSGKPLSDVVGKEMADKLMNLNKANAFEGDGLKIGGEGMKAFYDKMLVDKFNALGKKYGAKVSKAELKAAPKYEVKNPILNKDGDEVVSVYKDGTFLADMKKSEADHYIKSRKSKDKPVEVYTFPITPKLREQIKTKGQPLFSAGLPIYTPVDFNPFEDKTK